jgi:hypothetical protein
MEMSKVVRGVYLDFLRDAGHLLLRDDTKYLCWHWKSGGETFWRLDTVPEDYIYLEYGVWK